MKRELERVGPLLEKASTSLKSERVSQLLSRLGQIRAAIVLDTITTRFLLLFLFLLAIPLITVIIFTVSLLAQHLDEAANSQLALSKNLFSSAVSVATDKLRMLESFQMKDTSTGYSNNVACPRSPLGICVLINRNSGKAHIASLTPIPLNRLEQVSPVLHTLSTKEAAPSATFYAHIGDSLYLMRKDMERTAKAGTEIFHGIPVNNVFLNRIYRQQPDLETEIWILRVSDTLPQPILTAASPKGHYPVPTAQVLTALQQINQQTNLPLTVKVNATQYRILSEYIYSPSNEKIAQILHILPLTQTHMLLSNYYLGIYIIAVASLLFSVLLAMMAGRTITQPLLKLISQVNTLSRENVNKAHDEVAVTGVYEINQLGNAFNRMIKRLKQEHKMKDEFVATLTHDLKVPLLAEKQTLSYFLKEAYGPLSAEQTEVLDILKSSNRSCLSLVNGLLEVYRYESGEVSLVIESFNLAALMSETVGELLSLAQEKSITLEMDRHFSQTTENDIMVYADRLEIKRVLHNLISNAIINTPTHGSIRCKITDQTYFGSETVYKVSGFQYTTLKYPLKLTDRLLVSIQDSGIGFSSDDMPSLFKQFAASKGRNPMSIGLGLYNCYQVLHAHNGTLWVESTEGEGSTVNFILPVTKQAAQDRRVFSDRRRNA
ncbi:MAG: chemotaxis protein CheY [Vampirovibrio sp.]|jgi:signal transduction histidine kinase|nr:chemotaxis protein CheY [Vampirovibrio sp.]